MVLSRTFDGMCANEVLKEYASPSGHWKAVVFERNCGATTEFATHVALVVNGDGISGDVRSFFAADTDRGSAPADRGGGPEVRFRWLSDTKAELQHHRLARVIRAESAPQQVQVTYTTFER